MAGSPEPIVPLDPNAEYLSMTPETYIKERLIPHQVWYNKKYIRKKELAPCPSGDSDNRWIASRMAG